LFAYSTLLSLLLFVAIIPRSVGCVNQKGLTCFKKILFGRFFAFRLTAEAQRDIIEAIEK
jgi:hypothetical protein